MAHRVIEAISNVTTLGIRFWDPVQDMQIQDGLLVTVRPASQRRSAPFVTASTTASGFFAFHRLPGLVDFESGAVPITGSPLLSRRFRLEIADTRRRYLDTCFELEVPLGYRGLFPPTGGSPSSGAPGFLLFSSSTRQRPSWLGAVRGELAEAATGLPAAHALVAMTDPSGRVWRGVAGADGSFIVFLPFPEIEASIGGSPPSPGNSLMTDRSWPVQLEVFYQPSMQQQLQGTLIPGYQSILSQSPAVDVWSQAPDDGGTPQPSWLGDLQFGREVVARTDGRSKLLVGPPASP